MKKLSLFLICLICITLNTVGCSEQDDEGVIGDTTPTPEYTDP